MQIIRATGWDSLGQADWEAIRDAFRAGNILAYATDTIYGLGTKASSRNGLERILAIKGREEGKGMVVLAADVNMVADYCDLSDRREQAEELWENPRPTSLILPYRGGLAIGIDGGSGGLAVRLPKDSFLRKMIEEVGEPISSTSANRSGEAPLLSGQEIFDRFSALADRPDLVVDFGPLPNVRPSRILKLWPNGMAEVIRE